MAEGIKQADGSVRPEPTIDPSQVARTVVFMASLPLEANVQFITVLATTMPYIGRG
jgi:NADP-dependent 3-hydroxy acid dehydrogenase YdfG